MTRHFLYRLLTVILLLAGTTGLAWAQEEGERAERAEWTQNNTSGTFDLSSDKTITKKVTLSGNLTLNATKAVKLTRGGSFDDDMFVTNGHKLTIKGASGKEVTIDGGNRSGVGFVIFMGSGTASNNQCNLTYVTIQNNKRTIGSTHTGSALYGQGKTVCNNCIFQNNQSQYGGALYVGGVGTNVSLSCTDCQFINNKAQWGGGVCALRRATVTITGGSFTKNQVSERGGAIYIGNNIENTNSITVSSATAENPSLTLSGVTIGGSSANKNQVTGGDGGGVYIFATDNSTSYYGQATMSNCTITYNTASGNGGGVFKTGPLTILGTMVVKDNTASSAANDIFINSNAGNKYVSIASTGLSCGSSIGIYKNHSYTSNTYTSIVSGTPANCLYAYRNRFFFDDQAVSTVCDMNDSPYYEPSGGSGWLYFIKNTKYQAATASNTWYGHVDASGCTVDGSGYVTHIQTAAGFAYFSQQINAGKDYSGKTVYLDNDINLSAYNWEPVGYMADCADCATPFKGTFDGQYHVITGLKTPFQYPNMGLFGYVEGGTVTNTFVVTDDFSTVDINTYNRYNAQQTDNLGGLVGLLDGGTVSNSEAALNLNGNSGATIGGLVGKTTSGSTIHSCSAMPTISGGTTKGGLVGRLAGGTVSNSFANVTLTTSGTVGGLIGSNSGTMTNCYVRGTASFTGTTTTGTVTYCYGPSGTTVSGSNGVYTNPVAPYLYNHSNNNMVGSTALLDLLNQQRGSGAEWKRTTAGGYSGAGNINGDFPVHKYANTTCVASTTSTNGTVLDYHTSLDNMLTRHTSNTTVNLYAHDITTASTGSGVVVYIDENVSLLQDVGSNTPTSSIEAYTSQTLPGSPRSWHFLSSSLKNSGIGFNYANYAPFNWDPNPCGVTISSDNDVSLYPSDLGDVAKVDLYCFYEPEYHWINLKRRSDSHWHMNATTVPIAYPNETTLTPGKGYLVSIDQDQLLQNKGTLNNGNFDFNLDYTPHNEWAGLLGYNLLGNPYQSYFDFREFADQNSSLWYDQSKGHVEPTYAVYDPAMGGYIQYKEGSSRGSKSASGVLNMHQGFMIRVVNSTTPVAHFTNGMRTNNGSGVTFREEPPAYPLINLTVTDDEGVNDFAVLELGRDNDEGAEKLRANDCKGWLYLHHGDNDYGILFRTEVEDYQPLWFEADEAGTFTLSWEPMNADFESLTLIDNIAGEEKDMLAHSSYTFEANPDQYASRFKIVIGDWKDVDEFEGGASTGSATATFAYQSGDEIIVNGEGRLEVVDVTGRVIVSRDGVHTVSTNGIVPGVYLLRLTNGKETRIQKIIIK